MSLTGLEKAIILSISYSNVFFTPLTAKEVWLRLISNKYFSEKKTNDALVKLVKLNYLNLTNNYYSVVEKNLVDLRIKRKKFSQIKLNETKKLINITRLVPFIKAMVVTGSLSVANAKKNDDTDWLIITSKNTLWITRPLVILIASFYGKRRERNGNHRDNSWCFNMFMTEEDLVINKEKRSVYTAFEVCQAKFIYDKDGVEAKFLQKNKWVNKYLKNFYNSRINETKNSSNLEFINIFDNVALKFVNTILFYVQYLYMKRRITREVVQKNVAFFHPRNTHGKIFKQWKQIILENYNANH